MKTILNSLASATALAIRGLLMGILLLPSGAQAEGPAGEQSATTFKPAGGSHQISEFTGAFSYSYPVGVPPARSNVAPSIGLSYSSSGGNDWCGTGWSLSMGSIERESSFGIPQYAGKDTFTYGGSQLIQDDTDATRYHVRFKGSFAKINYIAATDHWLVTETDGTKYYYGYTAAADSKLGPDTNNNKTFRWLLDYVIDLNGNHMSITYQTDQHNGNTCQAYPHEITYNGNGALQSNHLVRFNLEYRDDVKRTYRGGFPEITKRRLSNIEVFTDTGATQVRKVILDYNQLSPATLYAEAVVKQGHRIVYNDANGSGAWEPGEDLWRDMSHPNATTNHLIYNGETTTPQGTTTVDIVISGGSDGEIADGTTGVLLQAQADPADALPAVNEDHVSRICRIREFGKTWDSDANPPTPFITDFAYDHGTRQLEGNRQQSGLRYGTFLEDPIYGMALDGGDFPEGIGAGSISTTRTPVGQKLTTCDIIDVNGDGIPDRVASEGMVGSGTEDYPTQLYVWYGEITNGKLTYSATCTPWTDPIPESQKARGRGFITNFHGGTSDFADYDGDGRPDRIIITRDNLAPQAGSFLGAPGAVDGTGNPSTADIRLWCNNGAGFMPPMDGVFPGGSKTENFDFGQYLRYESYGIHMIDVNGDGLTDRVDHNQVTGANSNSHFTVLCRDPDNPSQMIIPKFEAPTNTPTVRITEVGNIAWGSNYLKFEFANIGSVAQDLTGWKIVIYGDETHPAPTTTFNVPAGTISQPGEVFTVTTLGSSTSTSAAAYPNFNVPAIIWDPFDSGPEVAVLVQDDAGQCRDFISIGQLSENATPHQAITQPMTIDNQCWVGNALDSLSFDWDNLTLHRTNTSAVGQASDWTLAAHGFGTLHNDLTTAPPSPVYDLVAARWNDPTNWTGSSSSPRMGYARWGSSSTLAVFMDMNGDGLPDRVARSGDEAQGTEEPGATSAESGDFWIWFNTGSGFETEHVTWVDPIPKEQLPLDNGETYPSSGTFIGRGVPSSGQTSLMDINGDGLPDRLRGFTADGPNGEELGFVVWLNTGNGFSAQRIDWEYRYAPSEGADPEAQGFWWNAGTSLGHYGANLQSTSGSGVTAALRDVNGDGLPDKIGQRLDSNKKAHSTVWYNQAKPILMTQVTNTLGGKLHMDYTHSTVYDNTCPDGTTCMPSHVWTVSTITEDDGRGNTYPTTYSYKGGYQKTDYPNRHKGFRGFREVTLTTPDGTTATTVFHQGIAAGTDALAGVPSIVSKFDSQDRPTSKVNYKWEVIELQPGGSRPAVETSALRVNASTEFDENGATFTILSTIDEYDFDDLNAYPEPAGLNTVTRDYGIVNYTDFDNWTDLVYPSDHVVRTETVYDRSNQDVFQLTSPTSVSIFDQIDAKLISKEISEYFSGTGALKNKTTEHGEVDISGNPVGDATTQFSYGAYGNVDTTTSPNGSVTRFTYDATHTFPEISESAWGTPLSVSTVSTFDTATGAMLTVYGANGPSTQVTNTYDEFHRIESSLAPNGKISWYEYVLNRATPGSQYVRTYQMDANTQQNVQGAPDSYVFNDGLGRNFQTITCANFLAAPVTADLGLQSDNYVLATPNSQVIIDYTLFDSKGRAFAVTQPFFLGNTVFRIETQFDDRSRPKRIDYPFDPTEYADNYRTFAYTIQTDPVEGACQVTTTEYENNHESQATTRSYINGRGNVVMVEQDVKYTGEGDQISRTRYEYDPLGRTTRTILNSGHQSTHEYSLRGLKITSVDPDMGTWRYFYDKSGNLTDQIDAKNQQISSVYDLLNRITRKQYPDRADSVYLYGEARTGFYNASMLTSLIHANGRETLDYDVTGQTSRSVRRISGTDYTVSWDRDLMQRVTGTHYPDGSVSKFQFSDLSELKIVDDDNLPTNGNLAVMAGYNAAHQPGSIAHRNGVSTTYVYTPETLLLKSLATTKSNTVYQNLNYQFDQFGNITGIGRGTVQGGTATVQPGDQAYTYDSLDRLRTATTSNADQKSSFVRSFQYDLLGNITHKSDVGSYQYDPNYPHRLESVTDTVANERAFEYDANGNVIRMENRQNTEAYNAQLSGRVLMPINKANPSASEPPAGVLKIDGLSTGTLTFTLAQSGQNNPAFRIWNWSWTPPAAPSPFFQPNTDYDITTEFTPFGESIPIAGPSTTVSDSKAIRYNSENYPIAVTWRGRTTRFFYDANNERIRKTVSNMADVVVTNRYLVDGTTKLAAISAVKSTVYIGNLYEVRDAKTYRHLYSADQKLATIENDNGQERIIHYHSDHLGSTSITTDANGDRTEYLSYYPFGDDLYRIDDQPAVHDVRHTFTGQERDDETGLMNYGARLYDPSLGRFITADTIVPGALSPQNFNRYAYARNNPIRYTDPTGHFIVLPNLMQNIQTLIPPSVTEAVGNFVAGAVSAFTSDMAGGIPEASNTITGGTNAGDPGAGTAANAGATLGHAVAAGVGIAEIAGGTSMIGGGGALAVEGGVAGGVIGGTGGTAVAPGPGTVAGGVGGAIVGAAPGAAVVAGGIVVTGHGIVVAGTAIDNLMASGQALMQGVTGGGGGAPDPPSNQSPEYPRNPDDWAVPEGWHETEAGAKTGGKNRQWKDQNGNIRRRWDREGREAGKERGPHWHDYDDASGGANHIDDFDD